MANIAVDTSGAGVWIITTTSGTQTLPYTLCTYDLIPKRMRWISPTALAGDQVIIQDAAGIEVYREIAGAANADPYEQRPRLLEKWIGYPAKANGSSNTGVTITQFDSGTLEIHF